MHREDIMAMHCRQHQSEGHEEIVKLLLEKRCRCECTGRRIMEMHCKQHHIEGHEEIVKAAA
jgi:hypothetical protein